MRNRRAQMELLGLAIIMVIVVLGMMLALRFFFLVPPENPVQLARDTHLGANLLDSMFETQTTCNNRRLIQLVTDCATGGGTACPEVRDNDGAVLFAAGSSCEHATQIVQYMLDNTIKKQGRQYVFRIEGIAAPNKIEATNLEVINGVIPTTCEGSAHATERVKPIGNQQTLKFLLLLCE